MSMRVDLFITSPQGVERYRHEGACDLARDLFWGPIPTLEFIRSQPRVALHAPLGKDEQCDGAALLDLNTPTLTWFGGEDERLDVPLRRVHLRLMRAAWAPWTVQWAHGGLKQLAAAVGLSVQARRPPTRVLTLQQEHGARDIILTVRQPEGRTLVHTVGWDTPHDALCSHDRRWLHQLTEVPGQETWQRPRCLVPTGGIHIDLAARHISAWQAEVAYDAAQRLADAWRGWHTTWWNDGFEQHLAAAGASISWRPRTSDTLESRVQKTLLDRGAPRQRQQAVDGWRKVATGGLAAGPLLDRQLVSQLSVDARQHVLSRLRHFG